MNPIIRRSGAAILAFVLIFVLFPASSALAATVNFSGDFNSGDPLYDSLDAGTCTQLTPDNVYHDVYAFYVDTAGSYRMETTAAALNSGGDDTVLGLYANNFDPANPETNCVAYNSDYDPTGTTHLSRIDQNLAPGTQYFLIVSSYYDTDLGTYAGQITGPGNITFGMIPSAPSPAPGTPSSPGAPAGGSGPAAPAPVITFFQGYQDGRMNNHEAYYPVALYAQDYGGGTLGLHIYNIGAGGTEPWLIVTPEMIAAVGDSPAQNTLIARSPDGHIAVYRLTSGWFQVNAGPNAEGKISSIVFDRLCLGSGCAVYTLAESYGQ